MSAAGAKKRVDCSPDALVRRAEELQSRADTLRARAASPGAVLPATVTHTLPAALAARVFRLPASSRKNAEKVCAAWRTF